MVVDSEFLTEQFYTFEALHVGTTGQKCNGDLYWLLYVTKAIELVRWLYIISVLTILCCHNLNW